MVGHLMLYHPAVERLKQIIQDGDFGKLHYLYSQRVNLGQIRPKENAMWSLAPHDISIMMFLTGQTPTSVSATGYAYLQPNIEDVVFLNLQFTEKTAGHIHCSWLDPHKIRKLTVVGEKKMIVFDDMQGSETLKVYDKGFDKIDTKDRAGFPLPTIRFGDIWIPHVEMEEPLIRECRHFIECIETATQPRSDGRNGVEVLRVLHQAQSFLSSP